MKLLFITPYYAPDLGPAAPLYFMLSNELRKMGHEVTVITSVPHYPTGRVAAGYEKKFFQHSIEHEMHIVRIRVPSVDRSNLLQRAYQFTTYQIGAAIAALHQKFDVAIVTNPALDVWLPFALNVVLRRKPAIYSVQDLYPQVGIALGIFRNKFVISLVAALEKYCLKHSKFVTVIGESFRPGLHELGVDDKKIVLLYNWVDTDLIKPMQRDNAFSREHNLHEKFVVMYAGNIGLSQGLEHVITAAERLSDHADLHFVFVGEGAAQKQLMTLVKECNLNNVTFIPFQPRERLPEVLAAASVSLVPLRYGIGANSLPSKTYSIFASGRPILACMDAGSEAAELAVQSGAGIHVEPEDPEDLIDKILYLKNNPEKSEQMGLRGRLWAENYHSPGSAAKEIENLFKQLFSV